MRQRTADWIAGALAIAVLAFGGLVVVKPALDHWNDLYRGDPFGDTSTTETVTRERSGKPTSVTTTATESSSSSAERVLGDSGALLLRLCLVALAAFLLAATLRRAILGSTPTAGRMPEPVSPDSADEQATLAPVNGSPVDRLPREPATPTPDPWESLPEPELEPSTSNLAPAIATLVASRRESMGLSQRELAKRAGLSHTVISRIESGKHAPSAKTLGRLTQALR